MFGQVGCVLAVCALSCLSGCSSNAMAATWNGSPSRARSDLLELLPPGTPAEVATQQMEYNRFRCTTQLDQKWRDGSKVDVLNCQADVTENLVQKRRWDVTVVSRKNKVIDILASTQGP